MYDSNYELDYNNIVNKKMLGVIIVIVIAISGGVAYLLANKPDKLPEETTSQIQEQTKPTELTNQASSNQPGEYIDYNSSAIANASGTKLLFFHAPWCPQCRALETDIKEKGVPTGVTIIKVDYDSNQALRKKYGVTIQTTLVRVDNEGNLIKKYVAYNKPTLASLKENLLQ